MEDAEILNNLAYKKYINETYDDMDHVYNTIFQRYKNKEISLEEARRLHDLMYSKHIDKYGSNPNDIQKYIQRDQEFTEAETDHPAHMKKKYDAAQQLKKDPDNLKNKKYKSVESGKKSRYAI